MFKPVEIFIGWRYLKARRSDYFISFISLISIFGVGLGIMTMIAVLSVMNGFEKELTDRILGMASHATIFEQGKPLTNWRTLAADIEDSPGITGVAPYFQAEGMLTNGKNANGTVIRGILPEYESKVSVIASKMVAGDLTQLIPGKFGILLGRELAYVLGVDVGEKVTLITSRTKSTVIGILPALKRFTVVGIFDVGMHEFDSALAVVHMDDAVRLFRHAGPTGLRLKTDNIFTAPRLSRDIAARLSGNFWVQDWTQRHANFFRALKTEKTVMFFILILIVAVAAFNIISTLMMAVTDKQADVAILRTLGISQKSIMWVFIVQGTLIGLIGVLGGTISGILLALNIENIIPTLEDLLQMKFLSPDIYYISDLPSDMHWNDVIGVSVVSFLLCVSATIYPALRAAKIQPAAALRYE